DSPRSGSVQGFQEIKVMQRIPPIQPWGSGPAVFIGLHVGKRHIRDYEVVAALFHADILVGHDADVRGLVEMLRNTARDAIHLDAVHFYWHAMRTHTEEMPDPRSRLE